MDHMVSLRNNEHGSAAVAATESALMTGHKSARCCLDGVRPMLVIRHAQHASHWRREVQCAGATELPANQIAGLCFTNHVIHLHADRAMKITSQAGKST